MTNQLSWRFPIALQSLFATISFIGILMLPDTPRWYYAKGRTQEGDQVLQALHAKPLQSPEVQLTKNEILDAIALESTHARLNIMDILWDRSKLKTGRRLRVSFL